MLFNRDAHLWSTNEKTTTFIHHYILGERGSEILTNHVGNVKTRCWPHLGLKTRLFKHSDDSSFRLIHHKTKVDALTHTSFSTPNAYVLLFILVPLRLDRALQFVSEGLKCNHRTKITSRRYITCSFAISNSLQFRWVWRTQNICIAHGPCRHPIEF